MVRRCDRSLLRVLAVIWTLSACQGRVEGPRTFFVDGSAGSDSTEGLTAAGPWKSLEKVNAGSFRPGDRILFKAGTRYRGQLRPNGSGAEGRPIVVDAYGEGSKPRIDAEGEFHEALLLENQEFWEINNLELTNSGPDRQEFRFGVRIRSWDFGTVRHIHLKNLFVHDVNGSLVKRDQGEGHGIVWENGGEIIKSRFDGLQIEGCHLLRTDRNGISGYAEYPTGRVDWFPSLNVVIRGNLLEDIGGDGIKPWGCAGALVEHNTVRGGRQRCQDYAAGIWPWNCDDTLIQFNEVSGMKGAKDGQAFDSDAFCSNTVFQYNYSHDNDGGFMLICGRENFETVIRYNISQNDRARLFHFYDLIHGTRIYNNVFFVAAGIDLHLFLWTSGRSGWATDTLIANNIFLVEGTARNSEGLRKKEVDDGTWMAKPGLGGSTNVTFSHNIFYGDFVDVPAEWRANSFDPALVAPGTGGAGPDSVSGYKLREGSPAIGAGALVEENGGRDFWGNSVSSQKNPSIGAHEPVLPE